MTATRIVAGSVPDCPEAPFVFSRAAEEAGGCEAAEPIATECSAPRTATSDRAVSSLPVISRLPRRAHRSWMSPGSQT